jgi:hypothetical protein
MSSLQKAIRVGVPRLAASTAAGLALLNEWRAFYRLGVIAIEDVGVAGPGLCAAALIASVDKELRAEVGAPRLAALLAESLALSVKSRLVTDLYVARDLRWIGTTTSDMSETELIVANLSRRAWDGWWPIACAIVRADPPTVERREMIEPPAMIGDFLAAAYDMHCGEGRRSLAYFSKASAGVRRFFETHEAKDKWLAIGEAVFDAEGGLADRFLGSASIRDAAAASTRTYAGWAGLTLEQHRELVEIVRADLPVLHRSRERILAKIAEEDANKASQGSLPLQPPTPTSP